MPGIEPFHWDIVAPMGIKSSPPRKSHRNIFAGNAKDRLYALRLLVESSDARLYGCEQHPHPVSFFNR